MPLSAPLSVLLSVLLAPVVTWLHRVARLPHGLASAVAVLLMVGVVGGIVEISALDHAVQIYGSEHYRRSVQPWSCSAAPVHSPVTGELLGAIDVTGGDHVASPQMLTLVRATVAAVEAELAVNVGLPS